MTRYLIIGSGVAAIAAAEAIRSLDARGSIGFICEDPAGYYSRPGLAYYLSGELDEPQLFPYRQEDYTHLNAGFYQGQAARIFPAERLVEINPTTRLPYDRLLIATGCQAIRLNVPGADLDGVYKLDHMEDARRLIAGARRRRTAVVTGGGITALELAEGLAERHVKVHYVLRSERYWPGVLEPAESRIIETRLRGAGILLHPQREVGEILGRAGKVSGVRLTNGEHMSCDLLAYAIGIAPRTALAHHAGIACERGILVDEYMQTNLPGIYAAGDVAQVYDPVAQKHILDSLWPLAREQGRAAGLNMAGRTCAYRKTIPFNVTRLAGLTTTIIGMVGKGVDTDVTGIARGDSETWRHLPDTTLIAQGGFDVNHLRLVIGDRHILGAVLIGDQRLSTALQKMIAHPLDISPIRAALLVPGAPIADILADFWSAAQSSTLAKA